MCYTVLHDDTGTGRSTTLASESCARTSRSIWDRVKDGETLQVTEFGRIVALLGATAGGETVAVRADGARRTRDPAEGFAERSPPPPKPAPPGTPSTEEMLAADREELIL